MRAGQQPLEGAARNPVGAKAGQLERDQRIDVAGASGAKPRSRQPFWASALSIA
jgi:hypothetical protein